MSATNYLELQILDHLNGVNTWTASATAYLALHTGNPGETGASNEVSGGSYARKAVTNDNTEWSAASSGAAHNLNVQQFVQATANWGTITHFSVWDAASGGNCMFYGALNASKVINSGDYFEFAATALVITCD